MSIRRPLFRLMYESIEVEEKSLMKAAAEAPTYPPTAPGVERVAGAP